MQQCYLGFSTIFVPCFDTNDWYVKMVYKVRGLLRTHDQIESNAYYEYIIVFDSVKKLIQCRRQL